MALPIVSSLWVGPDLSWIEQLSLASFLHHGHRVKLYSYGEINGVPDGVERVDAASVYEPTDDIRQNAGPSMTADLFRLHLVHDTDEVWIDTDMVAVKALTKNENGFAIAYERQGKAICNAVLGAPRHSAAVQYLLDYCNDPHDQPGWLRPRLRNQLSGVPKEQLISTLFKVKRASLGPMALAYALRETGEVSEVRPRQAYFSVPWQFADVLFNPYGGTEGWMSEETEAVHLWSSALSSFHKTNRPHPESFVGALQQKLGIDVSHLKIP